MTIAYFLVNCAILAMLDAGIQMHHVAAGGTVALVESAVDEKQQLDLIGAFSSIERSSTLFKEIQRWRILITRSVQFTRFSREPESFSRFNRTATSRDTLWTRSTKLPIRRNRFLTSSRTPYRNVCKQKPSMSNKE